MSRPERRVTGLIAAAFAAAAGGLVAFVVVFWTTDSIVYEGLAAGVAFGMLAIGLVLWSHHLMPEGPYFEEYPDLRSPAHQEAEVLASIDRGGVGRRRLLMGSLGLFGVSLVAGVASTFRSLGPKPNSLAHTPWRDGRRLVDSDGRPVSVGDLPVGAALTVFPEGFISEPQVAAMLVRLPDGLNHPLAGRETWAPGGYICYSKVCSHAGCPVNLYNRVTHDLMCPCHQSTFDVTRGAKVVFGPAGSRLPQLPMAIADDGTLRSTGDFSAPPGPVFWHQS